MFEAVKELYYGLRTEGRRNAIQTARRARRAAREAAASAARRPAAS